ncbi:MAG: hypothetical protein HY582_04110, partial [Candidatus Omnitrophica bacterium]|nr:hypothetical protein [Candidatus Omnitrophota bacterium]
EKQVTITFVKDASTSIELQIATNFPTYLLEWDQLVPPEQNRVMMQLTRQISLALGVGDVASQNPKIQFPARAELRSLSKKAATYLLMGVLIYQVASHLSAEDVIRSVLWGTFAWFWWRRIGLLFRVNQEIERGNWVKRVQEKLNEQRVTMDIPRSALRNGVSSILKRAKTWAEVDQAIEVLIDVIKHIEERTKADHISFVKIDWERLARLATLVKQWQSIPGDNKEIKLEPLQIKGDVLYIPVVIKKEPKGTQTNRSELRSSSIDSQDFMSVKRMPELPIASSQRIQETGLDFIQALERVHDFIQLGLVDVTKKHTIRIHGTDSHIERWQKIGRSLGLPFEAGQTQVLLTINNNGFTKSWHRNPIALSVYNAAVTDFLRGFTRTSSFDIGWSENSLDIYVKRTAPAILDTFLRSELRSGENQPQEDPKKKKQDAADEKERLESLDRDNASYLKFLEYSARQSGAPVSKTPERRYAEEVSDAQRAENLGKFLASDSKRVEYLSKLQEKIPATRKQITNENNPAKLYQMFQKLLGILQKVVLDSRTIQEWSASAEVLKGDSEKLKELLSKMLDEVDEAKKFAAIPLEPIEEISAQPIAHLEATIDIKKQHQIQLFKERWDAFRRKWRIIKVNPGLETASPLSDVDVLKKEAFDLMRGGYTEFRREPIKNLRMLDIVRLRRMNDEVDYIMTGIRGTGKRTFTLKPIQVSSERFLTDISVESSPESLVKVLRLKDARDISSPRSELRIAETTDKKFSHAFAEVSSQVNRILPQNVRTRIYQAVIGEDGYLNTSKAIALSHDIAFLKGMLASVFVSLAKAGVHLAVHAPTTKELEAIQMLNQEIVAEGGVAIIPLHEPDDISSQLLGLPGISEAVYVIGEGERYPFSREIKDVEVVTMTDLAIGELKTGVRGLLGIMEKAIFIYHKLHEAA